MIIDSAFKALWKLAIFRYGGFGFEAPGEEEEECMNPRKQAPTRKQLFKKDSSASAKAAHVVHCFWRKCSAVFSREL